MDKNITLQDLQAQVEELKQLCGQIVEKLHEQQQSGLLADAYGSQVVNTGPLQ